MAKNDIPQSPDEPVIPSAPRAPFPVDVRIGVLDTKTGDVIVMPEQDYKGRDVPRPYARYRLPDNRAWFVVAPLHETVTEDVLKSFSQASA